jgi:hypothetical protein
MFDRATMSVWSGYSLMSFSNASLASPKWPRLKSFSAASNALTTTPGRTAVGRCEDVTAAGLADTRAAGFACAFADALADGVATGFAIGLAVGFAEVFAAGFAEGFAEVFAEGFAARFAAGIGVTFAEGFAAGFPAGFAAGFAEGFAEGFAADLTTRFAAAAAAFGAERAAGLELERAEAGVRAGAMGLVFWEALLVVLALIAGAFADLACGNDFVDPDGVGCFRPLAFAAETGFRPAVGCVRFAGAAARAGALLAADFVAAGFAATGRAVVVFRLT